MRTVTGLLLLLLLRAAFGYGDGGGEYEYYPEEEEDGGSGSTGGGRSAVEKIVDAEQEKLSALTGWLLDGYDRHRIPKIQGGLKVEVEIALVQFVSVSTSNEFIEIEGWWRFYWTDPRLAWNQTLWDVDFLTFTTTEIWMPDILAYEHIEDKATITDAQVYPSGLVVKSTPKKTKLGCPMNLIAFPFDSQECTFTVGSWSKNGDQLDVVPREKNVSSLLVEKVEFPARSALDMSNYVEFNSWRLDATRVVWKNTYYSCCPEPYPVIVVQLRISRSSRTHFSGIIGPMILVTLIGFAVLLMPAPVSGSRPAISITMMLTSVTVYFVASRSTPQSMQSTVVGRLYAAGIVMCSLNVFNSILATALNHIAPDEKVSNQALMEFFKAFDRDNSGVLEENELTSVFKILGITETEKRDILSVVESKDGGQQITMEQWKSLAELTMDSSDRGSYHNFLVKAIVRLGLRMQLHQSTEKKSIESFQVVRKRSTGQWTVCDGSEAWQDEVKKVLDEGKVTAANVVFSVPAQRTAGSPSPATNASHDDIALSIAGTSVPQDSGGGVMGGERSSGRNSDGDPADPVTAVDAQPARVTSGSSAAGSTARGNASPPGVVKRGKQLQRTRSHWQSFTQTQGYLKQFRGNRGIEALGQKLKQYTATQSNAQKMGKQLAATIDSWVLRCALPAYVIYIIVEFCGAWMGRPVEPYQIGFSAPPSGRHVMHEFYDYRSQEGVQRYRAAFKMADRSNAIDAAVADWASSEL